MAEQKRYLLRSTSGLARACNAPVFLVSVTHGGRRTHWSLDPAVARRFTAKQRDNFMCVSYAHVTGRWVLEKTALAKFAAADGVESRALASIDKSMAEHHARQTQPHEMLPTSAGIRVCRHCGLGEVAARSKLCTGIAGVASGSEASSKER